MHSHLLGNSFLEFLRTIGRCLFQAVVFGKKEYSRGNSGNKHYNNAGNNYSLPAREFPLSFSPRLFVRQAWCKIHRKHILPNYAYAGQIHYGLGGAAI